MGTPSRHRSVLVMVKVRIYVGGKVTEVEVPGPLSTRQAKSGKGKGAKAK